MIVGENKQKIQFFDLMDIIHTRWTLCCDLLFNVRVMRIKVVMSDLFKKFSCSGTFAFDKMYTSAFICHCIYIVYIIYI
jgi:hypothetical protein